MIYSLVLMWLAGVYLGYVIGVARTESRVQRKLEHLNELHRQMRDRQ